jgi:hypothetical protein
LPVSPEINIPFFTVVPSEHSGEHDRGFQHNKSEYGSGISNGGNLGETGQENQADIRFTAGFVIFTGIHFENVNVAR